MVKIKNRDQSENYVKYRDKKKKKKKRIFFPLKIMYVKKHLQENSQQIEK